MRTNANNGGGWIRTNVGISRQIYSLPVKNTSLCNVNAYGNGSANTSNSPSNAVQNESHLTALIDALAALPEAERPAIIEHVKALARLSSAKRTAVLTLVADDG